MKKLLLIVVTIIFVPALGFAASSTEQTCMRRANDYINQETARISSAAKVMDTSSRVAALQQSQFVFAEHSNIFQGLQIETCPAAMQKLTANCQEKLSAAAAQSEKLYGLALSIGLAEGDEKRSLIADFDVTSVALQKLQPEIFDLLKQLNMYFDEQGVQ